MAYTIKRYSNRKLYDTQTSRYITLEELRQLIRNGSEVRVEDAETGEDLTSVTLTQILIDTGRAHQTALPSALLHQLITHGDAWYGFLERALRTSANEQLSGTPRDVARFWTDWASNAGWPMAAAPKTEPTPTKNPEPQPATVRVEDELSALKEKLSELEKRLGGERRAAGRKRPRRPATRRPR